jgi:hypothetical protein
MNQVTIPAAEFIQLTTRILDLEKALIEIACGSGCRESANQIALKALATTEDCSADHLRDATKLIREIKK